MDYTQVGVNGIFVILVLKEILPFITKSNKNISGNQPVEYWQAEFRKAIMESLGPVIEDIKDINQRTLEKVIQIAASRRN